MDTETRKRIEHTLGTVKPTDTLVLAALTENGAVIHTTQPHAGRLVDLASSLLDQALDALREAGDEQCELADQIEDALSVLPDRFDEPAEPST